jgi:hypothetical protein
LIGARSAFQTYGNRLRHWIMGRKIDPDQISGDYFFGPPFEVGLKSNDRGEWKAASVLPTSSVRQQISPAKDRQPV